jgi:hypothetical protein
METGIHLVWSRDRQQRVDWASAMRPMQVAGAQRVRYMREKDTMTTFWLASAALIVPAMWVGHELLRRMHIL